MIVLPRFGQFLKNLSAITRCLLYKISAVERFDCSSYFEKLKMNLLGIIVPIRQGLVIRSLLEFY